MRAAILCPPAQAASAERHFDWAGLARPVQLPLADEAHLPPWRSYASAAAEQGVLPVLRERLVQLQFPILEGISQSPEYQAATRRGILPNASAETGSLVLADPAGLQLFIYEGAAGAIPVLVVRQRADFVTLVQALTRRNEPWPVPDSMGACLIRGLINWERARAFQRRWLQQNPGQNPAGALQALLQDKAAYQDRLLLLSEGFYSAVPAVAVGYPAGRWQALSLRIRLAHEYNHYLMARLFQDVQNHLLDELLADYAGMVAATGRFEAALFLRFMGLEQHPASGAGGRFAHYQHDFPAAAMAQEALVRAAANVARYSAQVDRPGLPAGQQTLNLLALSCFTLSELADGPAVAQLLQRRETINREVFVQ